MPSIKHGQATLAGHGSLGCFISQAKTGPVVLLLAVPFRVELAGQRLRVTFRNSNLRSQPATESLLTAFAALHDATPAVISRFVRRWGPLAIDAAGRFRRQLGWEHVDDWRHLAGRIDAVLRVGAALRMGRPGLAGDWQILGHTLGPLEGVTRPRTLKLGWAALETELNTWLRNWGPRLACLGRTIGLDGSGRLLSAVSFLLVEAVLRGRVYMCGGCSAPYVRRGRSPKRGEANFCASCGRGEAVRQAGKRWRARRIHEAR